MPFFSIIVPAYNRADFLTETLDSLCGQSFTDWECIVVDDGSTDHTAIVMKKRCVDDPRIRYVYQQNAERSAARNNGIDHALGQYICFLDSDDRYAANYLIELHLFLYLKNFPRALVISNFCIWDGKTALVENVPEVSENIAEWLYRCPVSPSRACVHKDILKIYRFPENVTIGEDTILWISILNDFPLLHLAKPLLWYRVHEGNSINKKNNTGVKRLHGLRLFFKDPLSGKLSHSFKNTILSDCYFDIGQYYFYEGNKYMAYKNLLYSIFLKPFHPQSKPKLFLLFCLIPGFSNAWHYVKKLGIRGK